MEEIEKKLRRVSQTIAPFLSSVGSGRILSYVMTQAKEEEEHQVGGDKRNSRIQPE